MCGIAGLVEKKAANLEHAVLEDMSLKIAHRGPDGAGLQVFEPEKLGLAHRRLAIIDLSEAAAQPMSFSERYCMVFNGEIYNYLEIKADLEKQGCQFSTQSDAEVLLQAYAYYGEQCLSYLDGMWAFCIFDREAQTLFCARDPFGVKPFYFLNNDAHFGFASEIKALLSIPSYKAKANPKAILDFLAQAQIELEAEGFFKDIFELLPGTSLLYSLTDHSYKQQAYKTHQEAPFSSIRVALEQTLTRRLRADVPVGFCLSGGLDSSTLLGLANQMQKTNKVESLSAGIYAFTAVHDSPLDERSWAQQMIDQTQVNWIQKEVTAPDLLSKLQDLIYHQDIPLLSCSTYAQSAVMEAASDQQIKILIDGQGGDELFAGYQVFYPTFFKELLLRGRIKPFIKEWKKLSNSSTTTNYILKEWAQDVLSILPTTITNGIYQRKKVAFQYLKIIPPLKRKRYNKLQAHLKAYREGPALKGLLRWEDRCSMQYSIESRTPFADALFLVKEVEKLSATKLIHEGWSKHALRQSMEDILPETITWRKDKKGFSVPQGAWLKETKNYWIELLHTKYVLDPFDFVDWAKLQKEAPMILDQGTENEAQAFVFRCCSYLLWLEIFNLGKLPDSK